MNNVTVEDMKKMQNDNYNVFSEMAMPLFLKNIDESNLDNNERKYWNLLKSWNLMNDVDESGATIFDVLWNSFEEEVWDDDFATSKSKMIRPDESTLLEAVLRDSSFKFLDKVTTGNVETLPEIITSAFKKSVTKLKEIESAGSLPWGRHKDTKINHLLSLPSFSRPSIAIGGGRNVINATKTDHGPSWRMVVQMSSKTEAYGVYPGGQSGNPGSRYYDNFINDWAAGIYYKLWVMEAEDTKSDRVKWRMTFSKS
jgi:penicillin amidase